MSLNKIKPYTFCKLKDGNYFLIVEVKKRRVDLGLLNELVCEGAIFDSTFVKLDPDLVEVLADKINIRTASFQKINSFIFKHDIKMNNWIYFDEIESFIKRKEIEFSVPKDFEIKYI